jgi:hypothetical protein
MSEQPHKAILDRDEAAGHAKEHFSAQLKLLQELANYGSNLIIRAYHFSNKRMADVIVCGVLLKQIVAMLDAIEILIGSGATHAAHLPARTAFEASLYLEWILVSDSEKKATYYYVANLREERLWASRTMQGTPESEDFADAIKDLNFDIHKNRPSLAKEAQQHLAEVNRILSQPELVKIDKEFEKNRGRRKYDREWHSLLGPKSIRRIAEMLHRIAEYNLFYAKGSQVTHSASYKDHIKFVGRGFHFKPIRHLDGINALLNFTVSLTLRTYQTVLHYYRPGEMTVFSRRYVEECRESFLHMKSVKYNF